MSHYSNYEINQQVAQNLVSFFVKEYVEQDYHYNNSYDKFIKYVTVPFDNAQFKVDWSLGGTYGHYSGGMNTAEPEIEPELTPLDNFLMHAYPQTSFMQYKVLSQAISRSTYGDSDYYGGRTTHAEKALTFADLSSVLTKVQLEPTNSMFDKKQIIDFVSEIYTKEWFLEVFPDTAPKVTTTKKNKKK